MKITITEQIKRTADYLAYMEEVAAEAKGVDMAGLDLRCYRFGEVWVFSDEYCGDYSWSGEGAPAEALRAALDRYRHDLAKWNERGKRSRELARAGAAIAQTCLGSPVSIAEKYTECVNGDGSTKSKFVSGFRVTARELVGKQVRFFGSAAISRYRAVSSNMESRRAMVSADFDDPGDAEKFINFLLSFCDKAACERCKGTGLCLACEGEGCSKCDGDPECGECVNGMVMVWAEG